MSNSKLVSYTRLSPNHSGKRRHAIDTISIHCMAGNLSVESCGRLFADRSREAAATTASAATAESRCMWMRATAAGALPAPATTTAQ